MSQEVLRWRRFPTAFGNSSALTSRGNRPAAPPGALLYLDLGAETIAPAAIRASLKGALVNNTLRLQLTIASNMIFL